MPGLWLGMAQRLQNLIRIANGVQQVVRRHVQQQSPEVCGEAVTAQPVHRQSILQFVVAHAWRHYCQHNNQSVAELFAFATLDVLVVELFRFVLGRDLATGHYEPQIGSNGLVFRFDHDGPTLQHFHAILNDWLFVATRRQKNSGSNAKWLAIAGFGNRVTYY